MGREKLAAGQPDGMPKQLRYPRGRDDAFWRAADEAVTEAQAEERKARGK